MNLKPLLLGMSMLAIAAGTAQSEPVFTYLKTNLPDPATFQSGGSPLSQVIQGSDNKLYGTAGNLYSINKDGTGYSVVTTGTNSFAVSGMAAPLEASDGRLYFVCGMTDPTFTGFPDTGFLCGVNKDGSGFQALGPASSAAVIEGTDHVLYGVYAGANNSEFEINANNKGHVFKVNLNGTGYTELYNFTNGAVYSGIIPKIPSGALPNSPLLEGSDGALYGMTWRGGGALAHGYAVDEGTIYKLNKDGSAFTVLHNFDSSNPSASLDEDNFNQFFISENQYNHSLIESGGKLYGVHSSVREYVIFRMDLNGSNYTILHSFPAFAADGGGRPVGVVVGPDNKLYGTADDGQRGNAFRMNKDGSNFEIINYGVTRAYGAAPLIGSDGALYGLSYLDYDSQYGGALFKISNPQSPDITAPALNCTNISVAATNASGTVVSFKVAHDNMDPSPTVIAAPPSGSMFPIGTTTVNVTAYDQSGNTNSCSFNVTVNVAPPTINKPSDIVLEATNPIGNAVTFSVSASDPLDATPTVVVNPAPGSIFPIGTNIVTVTAYNSFHQTNTQTFKITIRDTTAPTIVKPSFYTGLDPVNGGMAIDFTEVVYATDAGDANPTVIITPPSGSVFPIGTNAVQVVAYDRFFHTNTASFIVIVRDITAPQISCPGTVAVMTSSDSAIVDFSVPVTDKADPTPSVTVTPPSGSSFPIGTNSVLVTAIDHSGNSNYCSFNVVVSSSPHITTQPVSQPGTVGGSVTFSVTASGSGTLTYQWIKNGTPISGATGTSYTVNSIVATSGNDSYWVKVSSAYGAVISSTAKVLFPPMMIQPAMKPSTTVREGQLVSMTATGAKPGTSYQWILNGVPIPGATGSSYTNFNVSQADHGFYAVTLSNAAGSATSTNTNAMTLVVLSDSTIPTVTLAKPAANTIILSTTNAGGTITASGTASDNARVTGVFYRLNNSAWAPVELFTTKDATGLSASWTTPVSAAAGTNLLEIYAQDWTGNTSKVVKSTFFFNVEAPLTVMLDEHDTRPGEGPANYSGSVSSIGPSFATPTNGALLYANRGSYRLIAKPGYNQSFQYWSEIVDGVTNLIASTNLVYQFSMRTNLTLVAHFGHNPFVEAQGVYYGLITNDSGTTDLAGYVSLKVATNGMFSAMMVIDGVPFSPSGKMDYLGHAHLRFDRSHYDKPNLDIILESLFGTNGFSGTNQIVGTISDGNGTATLIADQSVFSNSFTNRYAGTYTMVLPGSDNAAESPAGHGFATVTVSSNATMTAVGALADSTPLAPLSTAISLDGRWPVFQQLYAAPKLEAANYTNDTVSYVNSIKLGVLMGWLQFTNHAAIGGQLLWLKAGTNDHLLTGPAGAYSNYYAGGFTNKMEVLARSYTQPTNVLNYRLLAVTNAFITFADGNLPQPQSQALKIKSNNSVQFIVGFNNQSMTNILSMTASNSQLGKLSVAFNPSNGKVTGTFTNVIGQTTGGAAKPIVWSGVVIQPLNVAYGYFLGPNQSGSVNLRQLPGNTYP